MKLILFFMLNIPFLPLNLITIAMHKEEMSAWVQHSVNQGLVISTDNRNAFNPPIATYFLQKTKALKGQVCK